MSGIGPAMDMAMDVARSGDATAPLATSGRKAADATPVRHGAHAARPASEAGTTASMSSRNAVATRSDTQPSKITANDSTAASASMQTGSIGTDASVAQATPPIDAAASTAQVASRTDTSTLAASDAANTVATAPAPPAQSFATAQSSARPMPAASPADAGSLGGTVFALLLVIGLILGLGWLARRMPGFARGASNNGLRMVASLPVGPRERVVVVEVGHAQLLLGVGPGGTRTLHTLDAPLPEAGPAQAPQFAQLLAQHFGKKA